MPQDLDASQLQALAANHGLTLSPEEAQEALAGVNRWRNQVEQLRNLVTREMEPATAFHAPEAEPRP